MDRDNTVMQVTKESQIVRVKNGMLYNVEKPDNEEEKELRNNFEKRKRGCLGITAITLLVLFLLLWSIEYLFSGIFTKFFLNAIITFSVGSFIKVLWSEYLKNSKERIKSKYWQGPPQCL